MPTKYTAEELRDASNKVMKSLNWINGKTSKGLTKSAIPNSTGLSDGKISKSSRKRQNKKARANLAGKPMENLLEVIPEAPKPSPVPLSEEEFHKQRASEVNKRAHHSRRAERRLAQHEISNFSSKSLDEIKAKLAQMKGEPAQPVMEK